MDHEFGGGSQIQWRVDRLGMAKEKLGDDWSTGYRAVVARRGTWKMWEEAWRWGRLDEELRSAGLSGGGGGGGRGRGTV